MQVRLRESDYVTHTRPSYESPPPFIVIDNLIDDDRRKIDFDGVFDDLTARGWISEEAGTLTLTDAGEAGLLRARERSRRANDQMHDGIEPSEYVAAINVLRHVIANLGGTSDLP